MMRTPQILASHDDGALQGAMLLFAVWLCLVIDGALPTAELIVTGNVVLPPVVPKVAIAAIGLAITFFSRRWRAPPLFTAWIAAFTIYLCACTTFWPASTDSQDSGENLLFYHAAFILLALSYSCSGRLTDRSIVHTILALSVPLALLGIAQHLSGDPLIPQDLDSVSSSSPEDYFNINSPNFYGQLRGFSLFTSGLAFGHFLNLAIALLIPLFCKSRGYNRLSAALLLALCGEAVYSTLTRAIYVQLAFVASSALLFTLIPRARRFIGTLTLVFGIMAAALVFLVEPLAEVNSGDILANDSMVLRLTEWAGCWEDLTTGSVWTLLLGTGFMQGKSLTIDNGPIAVIYQAGIIGLVFWAIGIFMVLRFLKQRLAASPNPLTIGIAAYATSWLCATMFNLATDDGARIAILLVLSQSGAPSATSDPVRTQGMTAGREWTPIAPARESAPAFAAKTASAPWERV